MLLYVIEDEIHAEDCGRYDSREDALRELKRLAGLPWDGEPNRSPCTNWRECGREYVIVEYDTSGKSWTVLSREPVFSISAEGVVWSEAFR